MSFLNAAHIIEKDLVIWRRHLHRYPELSGQEALTANYVAEQLSHIGFKNIQTHYANTHAVVVDLQGTAQGADNLCVALRADMDALPIEEQTGFEYASQHEGVMHACGHDAHTAMLLGAARLLWENKHRFSGRVRFIFQPAEERIDLPGARHLIEQGVLQDVQAIFGQHVYTTLDMGQVGLRTGPFMASADIFQVELLGQGTHASRPHMGVDPVLMAAQAINAMHHIVSRKVNPSHPAVLTVGYIQGGNTENVIPDKVRFGGTVRTLDIALREQMPQWIEETLKGICLSHGGDYSLEYQLGTPPVINAPHTSRFAQQQLTDLLGEKNVCELEFPSMGGEDFGEYLLHIPGMFYRLGVRTPTKTQHPLHSPRFELDEGALVVGSASLAHLAMSWLNSPQALEALSLDPIIQPL